MKQKSVTKAYFKTASLLKSNIYLNHEHDIL